MLAACANVHLARPIAAADTWANPELDVSRRDAAALRQHAVQVVRDSCLVQFLVKELYQTSYTEMSKRGQYYATALHVARLLCVPELAPELFAKPVSASAGSAAGDGQASAGAADSLVAVLERAAAQVPACRSCSTG